MLVLSVLFLLIQSTHGGISRTGNPLAWKVAKPVLNSVRLSGVKQFIYHYNRSKHIETPLFLWGDEIEYGLFGYDQAASRFDLSMRGKEIREQLSGLEQGLTGQKSGCEWQVSNIRKTFSPQYMCKCAYYCQYSTEKIVCDMYAGISILYGSDATEKRMRVTGNTCRGRHY